MTWRHEPLERSEPPPFTRNVSQDDGHESVEEYTGDDESGDEDRVAAQQRQRSRLPYATLRYPVVRGPYGNSRLYLRTSTVALEPTTLLSNREGPLRDSRRRRAEMIAQREAPHGNRLEQQREDRWLSTGRRYIDVDRRGRRTYVQSLWNLRAYCIEWRARYGDDWIEEPDIQDDLEVAQKAFEIHRCRLHRYGRLQRAAVFNRATRDDNYFESPSDRPRLLAREVTMDGVSDGAEGGKRSAGSVNSDEDMLVKKRRKKVHKKFTSVEEAEQYAAAERDRSIMPAPQGDDEHEGKTRTSHETRKTCRRLVLHGPKAPTDDVDGRCVRCEKLMSPGAKVACSKCGRWQYCSVPCKNADGREYCCFSCWKEDKAGKDGEDKRNVKGTCLVCNRRRDRLKDGAGFSCLYCGNMRFCSQVCRDEHGFVNCSRNCRELNTEALNSEEGEEGCVVCGDSIDENIETAVPCHGCRTMQFCAIDCKDSHGEYNGHCTWVCQEEFGVIAVSKGSRKKDAKKTESFEDKKPSLLDDPGNFDFSLDDAELSDVPDLIPDLPEDMLDPNSHTIINHNLTNDGRYLQYELESRNPKLRQWVLAVDEALNGVAWTDKMRLYWQQGKHQRQRAFMESKDEPTFDVKYSSFSRYIPRMEIERHRSLSFVVKDPFNAESREREICSYGGALDQS